MTTALKTKLTYFAIGLLASVPIAFLLWNIVHSTLVRPGLAVP